MSDTPVTPAKLDPTSITAAIYAKSDLALQNRVDKAFATLRKELEDIGALWKVNLGYMMRQGTERSKLSMSDMYSLAGDGAVNLIRSEFISEFRDSERQKAVDAFVAKVEAVEGQVQEIHNMVDDVRHEVNNR